MSVFITVTLIVTFGDASEVIDLHWGCAASFDGLLLASGLLQVLGSPRPYIVALVVSCHHPDSRLVVCAPICIHRRYLDGSL